MVFVEKRMNIKSIGFTLFFLLALLVAAPSGLALADHPQPGGDPLAGAAFEQKINAQAPLDLAFRDEAGRPVRLGDYFGQRPVILLFAYYECPMLCTLVLNELTSTLRDVSFNPADQFEVVIVSMDPGETPEMAAAKKSAYLEEYGRPGAEQGWHFLTGDQAEIAKLAEGVGFRYVYDAVRDEYAHPTGVILLTPQGRISRYLLGIGYSPGDIRLGLVEASSGAVGSPADQFTLLCYAYDPVHGRYTLAIEKLLRLAGLATAGGLAGLIFVLFRRERAGLRDRQAPGQQRREGNAP
jgi:protein SCO1/2